MSDAVDHDPTWNLSQLFAWVLTRESSLVSRYADQADLALGDAERTFDRVHLRASIFRAAQGAELGPDFQQASRSIRRVLAAGRIAAFGVGDNKDDAMKIPRTEWGYLEFSGGSQGDRARPVGTGRVNARAPAQPRFSITGSRPAEALPDTHVDHQKDPERSAITGRNPRSKETSGHKFTPVSAKGSSSIKSEPVLQVPTDSQKGVPVR